jgi:hypothetical protein
MPQPKSSSGSATRRGSTSKGRSSTARKPAARSSTARKPAARKGTARKPAARKSTARPSTARPSTARKPASRARTGSSRSASPRAKASTPARRPAPTGGGRAGSDDALIASLGALREHLARGIVLTAERLQTTLDDTVRRGRITRDDAEDLLQSLVDIGRKQTDDVLADLEQIFGRSPGGGVAQAARDVRRAAADRVGNTAARAARSQGADRVLREVDRARRATGLGSSFPIIAYEGLSATQIVARLDDLTAPQLRKVRDYERRHDNRKSVLDAIERRLSS